MSDLASSVLLVVGGLFLLLAAIGIVRMPDLYMRMGAATKGSSLGLACVLLAAAVHFGELAVATWAVLVLGFVVATGPIAAHMLGRAAYLIGVPLWNRTIVDELKAHGSSRPSASQNPPDQVTSERPTEPSP